METVSRSMKSEFTACKIYDSGDDANAGMHDYIQRFYNSIRHHSNLGFIIRTNFESKVDVF